MPRANVPVVLITGVSGGIGRATAELFASRGWIVVGTVRGRRGKPIGGLDVQLAEMTRPQDLERLVAYIANTYGRLDVVVANAGYALVGPLTSLDYDQIRDQLLVNAAAPAYLARLALPLLLKAPRGALVAISSVAGRTGLPGYSAYAASKHAVEATWESLAFELEGTSVRLRLIEPSSVDTDFWRVVRRGTARRWSDRDMGRLAAPEQQHRHHLSIGDVASAIFSAATSRSHHLRYPLGTTKWVALAKRLLPDAFYRRMIKKYVI